MFRELNAVQYKTKETNQMNSSSIDQSIQMKLYGPLIDYKLEQSQHTQQS